MKSSLLARTAASSLCALIVAPALVTAQQQRQVRYEIIDLGTFPGAMFSQAYGLNSKGDVGGYAATPDGSLHAFLWKKHKGLQDLGTLGGPNSFGSGPNKRDEVPVAAETAATDPNFENFCGFGTGHICLAAVWRHGVMKPLPNLASEESQGTNSQAVSINNRGQLAGYSETGVLDPNCSIATPSQAQRFEAVLWDEKGKVHELRPLPGDTVGFALSINDAGLIAGSSGTCATTPILPLQIGPHAVIWDQDGTPTNLGTLGGSAVNTAAALNDSGQVVGGASTRGNRSIHTFLWTKGHGMHDLGTVGNDLASIPGGMGSINNNGQVVGQSCDVNPITAQTPPKCRAYLWRSGKMLDLNTLIAVDSPLYLNAGFGINDRGEITGYGTEIATGDTHAFLLIPIDCD